MPRRLLVICHGFPPYYGGAEHAAGYLARAAARSGRWAVEVLTSDIGGRLAAHEEWEGVTVRRVRAAKREWARHTVPELLSFLRAASAFHPAGRPDWILAHFTLPAGEVARRIARRTGAPYAVVLQGSDVPGYQNRRFGPLYAVTRSWTRRVWRDAGSVVAVSEALRELALRTWPEGGIDVVPNGVDLERFRPSDPRTASECGARTILVVAQLIERKGIQHLIDALALCPPGTRARWKLRLCGTGPYEGELRRRARVAGLSEKVEFAGLVPHADLPSSYRDADLFVLPTLQEGLPLAMLEAMASGLPVVASGVGGIPTVIDNGRDGLLVPPGDVRGLADAMQRILSSDAEAARLGAAARARAEAWGWDRLWIRYEDALGCSGAR